MAFEFRAPSGPNIGLIAQLIQAPAQARAEAAVRAGQAWGGAAQQIGQTVAALPQQIQQQHRQQTLDSMNDLKLSEMQRDVSGQRAVAGMMAGDQLPAGAAGPRQESFLDENGLFDIKKITATLGAAGYGDKASDLVSGAEKINDSILKHQQLEQQMGSAQALMFGDMADGALKLAKSGTPIPQAMDFVVQPALATHRIDPKQYAQLRDQMAQLPPDQQAAALTSLMDQAAKLDKGEILPEGAIKADRYGRTMASGAPKPPSEPELALQASGGDPAKAMDRLKPPPKTTLEQKSVTLDGKPNVLVNYDPATGKSTLPGTGEDVSARVKGTPPASMQINQNLVPTGDALSMAARRYLATGELPAMGMGQAGAAARVAVMNEAAKIDPQASLAANAATFKADSANLKNLQTTEGTLSAFEKTAGKNLDQFLSLADKIPDTGVPWLNTPVRLLNNSLVGSSNQAAFNAARDVALREIARVTNDPKLSGVLSDSARQEVSALNPQNATFAQIKAVAKVLKQDMANVHSSLNDQIATVKSGMGSQPGAGTVSAAEGDTKPIPGFPGTEQTYRGGKWIRTK